MNIFNSGRKSQLSRGIARIWMSLMLAGLMGVAQAQYAGFYSGAYIGGETGTWRFTIDDFQNVSGYITDPYGSQYSGSGSVSASGGVVIGFVSAGASFTAQIDAAGRVAGTWTNASYGLSGSFSGTRKNPTITSISPLPACEVGTAYKQTLKASGATTPYTWLIVAGSLPDGFSLSSSGVITGTAQAVMSADFTVQVTGGNSLTATKAFSLQGALPVPVPPVITWANPAAIAYGTALSATQLNAKANVPGTYEYTPAAGSKLSAGTQSLNVTFTPTDSAHYTSAQKSVSLVVAKGAQTITFPAPPALRYGDADVDLTASATSGLAVSYVSSNPAVATIVNGNQLHVVGVGSVTVTASQAGDVNWKAAPAVARTLVIGKQLQAIDFPALASRPMGGADFAPGATASSGLTVTFTSSAPAVATIVAGKIHLVGKGTAVITASQAGNANWAAAAPAKQTLVVTPGSQSITFLPLPSKGVGDVDFAPGATASSGLAVTYVSSNLKVATIVAGKIHVLGDGTSTITAKQAGNASWSAAVEVTQTFTVGGKATPVLTWGNPAAINYGTVLSATQLNAKANVPGTYAYSPPAGTKLPVGQQSLNVLFIPTDAAKYNTTQKSVFLTVNKVAATVTLAGLSQTYTGQPRSVTATTVPAGLPVDITYGGSPDAPTAVGSYPVVATVNDPNAGGTKSATLLVGKGNQTINFASLPTMHMGDADAALTASAASGLAVSYTSSNAKVATIVDGKIHFVGVGAAYITATQGGDSNWNAALAVKQLLTVGPEQTTLDIAAYAGLSGTRTYHWTEPNKVDTTWSTDVTPTTRNGREVYLVQEYSAYGTPDDQTFLLADVSAGLFETGGLNDNGKPTESTRYWTPDLPRLMKTFVPGQEYSVKLTRNDMPGYTLTWKIKTVAEKVTVPYGTYDTYKVSLTLSIPLALGGGTHTDICWYAANLGLIKRVQDVITLWELTDYQP
jgi:hypothetical protein